MSFFFLVVVDDSFLFRLPQNVISIKTRKKASAMEEDHQMMEDEAVVYRIFEVGNDFDKSSFRLKIKSVLNFSFFNHKIG